jgi:peptidoglycan hydrolase-like protein with peptidoglycan-binding domain
MVFALTWMPGVLKEAGLKVAEVDGWESRGRADMGQPLAGVICHHTAGPPGGNMPSLRTLLVGRPDLPGPLAQLGLGRDGTFYVLAAGRCNHAGRGEWQGSDMGNSRFIGIEAEHTGQAADPWPDVQQDAYRRGVAALLKHLGRGADACAGHKEYARPLGRKPDPAFDMAAFRAEVAALLAGTLPVPPQIPAQAPPATPGAAPRPTLRRPDCNASVKELQSLLGIQADGFFGPKTEAAVREFQRRHGLVPDGIFGPRSWDRLDAQ